MYVIGMEICPWDGESVPEMDTVPIWQRDPNLNPSSSPCSGNKPLNVNVALIN